MSDHGGPAWQRKGPESGSDAAYATGHMGTRTGARALARRNAGAPLAPRDRAPHTKKERPPAGGLPVKQGSGDAGTRDYIPMPPMPPIPPPAPAAPADSSFGFSAIIAIVVSMSEATDAAFCSAVRETFVGSMTPAFTRSS